MIPRPPRSTRTDTLSPYTTRFRSLDRPIYDVRSGRSLRLLDARTGDPVAIDERLATEIARSAYHHEAPVRQVTFLQEPNLEARDFSGSMWRVDFANEDNSSSYVSAETGQPLVDRSDTWRVWDFVWMLHNMDYVNRTSFNHPLIIFAGFSALRSEEHTSELQSLMRISYAVFCLK